MARYLFNIMATQNMPLIYQTNFALFIVKC